MFFTREDVALEQPAETDAELKLEDMEMESEQIMCLFLIIFMQSTPFFPIKDL